MSIRNKLYRDVPIEAAKQVAKVAGMQAAGNILGAINPFFGTIASLVDLGVDLADLSSMYNLDQPKGLIDLDFAKFRPSLRFLGWADLIASAMDMAGAAHTAYTDNKMDDYRKIGNLLSDEANVDYNMRKALKEHPEWAYHQGHFDDTYKKSNHRTFSNHSQYWKPAMDYASRNGLISDDAYKKMMDTRFSSWYKDKAGKMHYIPQLYQYNDPEWQNYMRTQEKGVIIDAPIEGSLQQALPIVIGDDDKVRLSTEDINKILGVGSNPMTDGLAMIARDNPGVVDFVNDIDKYTNFSTYMTPNTVEAKEAAENGASPEDLMQLVSFN